MIYFLHVFLRGVNIREKEDGDEKNVDRQFGSHKRTICWL